MDLGQTITAGGGIVSAGQNFLGQLGILPPAASTAQPVQTTQPGPSFQMPPSGTTFTGPGGTVSSAAPTPVIPTWAVYSGVGILAILVLVIALKS